MLHRSAGGGASDRVNAVNTGKAEPRDPDVRCIGWPHHIVSHVQGIHGCISNVVI